MLVGRICPFPLPPSPTFISKKIEFTFYVAFNLSSTNPLSFRIPNISSPATEWRSTEENVALCDDPTTYIRLSFWIWVYSETFNNERICSSSRNNWSSLYLIYLGFGIEMEPYPYLCQDQYSVSVCLSLSLSLSPPSTKPLVYFGDFCVESRDRNQIVNTCSLIRRNNFRFLFTACCIILAEYQGK